MHGDDLAVFLALEGVGLTLFLEGRREDGWRKYVFWGACALTCLVGILWPKVESVWPQGANYGHSVAGSPETWVMLFFLVMALVSFSGIQSRIAKTIKDEIETRADAFIRPLTESGTGVENTAANALEIRFEDSDVYSHVQRLDSGIIIRSYDFRLYNMGNGFVTDTMVFVTNTSVAAPRDMIRTMAFSESLPRGQYRTVRLAHFSEIVPDGQRTTDTINLGWVHGGGFLAGSMPCFSPANKTKPLVVEVKAIGRECADCTANFRIWIDEDPRRLRVQKF